MGLSMLLSLRFLRRAMAYYSVGNSAFETDLPSGNLSANSPVALRFPRATNFLGLSSFCSSSLLESLRLVDDALLPTFDPNTSTLTSLHDRIFFEILLVDMVTSEKSIDVALKASSSSPSFSSSFSPFYYSPTLLLLFATFYSVWSLLTFTIDTTLAFTWSSSSICMGDVDGYVCALLYSLSICI